MDSDVMVTDEVAELLRKPRGWVIDNAERVGLPRYRVGRQWRYVRGEVLAWLRDERRAA